MSLYLPKNIRHYSWLWKATGLCLLFLIYKRLDPGASAYFPKCPFKALTGYDCPGCGSQRALHHIFNMEITAGWKDNFLVVLAIPYLIVGVIFDQVKNPISKTLQWRKWLYGPIAIKLILAIVFVFWIVRNI